MTKEQAYKILAMSSTSECPSRVNKSLSCAQAVRMVRAGVESTRTVEPLVELMEKRVWQVALDMKCPSDKAKAVMLAEILYRDRP
jgi:hypothetical protein